MPDRFTEEEARQVFARAAERQHAADAAPAGLSLAELQEVGAAAGLAPEHVAAAVAEVRGGAEPAAPPATFLGVDVEPRASRVLPGAVTDEVWGQMVGRLRPTFKTIGVTSEVGAAREWQGTNERGGLSNLRATAEPVDGGTLVSLGTSKAGAAAQYRALSGVFGVMAVFFVGLSVATDDWTEAGLVFFFAALAVAALLSPILGRQSLARWAERRRGEFDALLDGFELLVRDAAPPQTAPPVQDRPAPADAAGAGRLDLDAPPGASEAEAPRPDAPARQRTRA